MAYSMHVYMAMAMVFIGCGANVFFLELIVSEYPGSGNIITFAQFLLIAVEGFVFTSKFGTKRPVIPFKNYFIMVAFFFSTSVVNNYALNFKISVPLHTIFRSGSLIANMALGIIILHKRYAPSKYMAIFMISAGICLCTLMSAKNIGNEDQPKTEGFDSTSDFMLWIIGLCMLTFALFLSARMGIFQETLYKAHGKHPREALFYSHALPLPGFLLMGRDIYHHAVMYSATEPIVVGLGIAIPKMWLYLIGNMLTQYICIRSVFILTSECPSLITTLVVTLRKFISLVASIIFFQNPFTLWHWVGTTMVFGGTLLFTGVLHQLKDAIFVRPPPASQDKKTD
ncbi:UDP-xylose and UDP-N-acetylglucosamine transporter-like [Lytechinus pictus]|uniref:UDP-xylose and UDP-N-acetylglucosamine transporter-like n=1 Tax=Lytechinus pictus TaxID=7653 RepID=UPI0030B9E011